MNFITLKIMFLLTMQTPLLRLISFSRATNLSFSSLVMPIEFFSLSFLMSPIFGTSFRRGASSSGVFRLFNDLEKPNLANRSYISPRFYFQSNLISAFLNFSLFCISRLSRVSKMFENMSKLYYYRQIYQQLTFCNTDPLNKPLSFERMSVQS